MRLLKVLFVFAGLYIPLVINAAVNIEYAGKTIVYEDNPRLSTVLSRLVLNKEFYWHGASLYRLNTSETTRRLSEFNALLNKVKSETGVKTEKMAALQSLQKQVSQWQVAERLPFTIDYDLIRIREELNPRFEDGEYFLHLPFRTYEIQVVGAVHQPKRVPHMATKDVKAYLGTGNIEYLAYADNNLVYIIHPNGSIKKVSLGLHNTSHIEVPPGGTLYVPIRELPFSNDNTKINELVAQLAGSRLP